MRLQTATFYGVNINTGETIQKEERSEYAPYIYFHNKIECANGYDICEANFAGFRLCLRKQIRLVKAVDHKGNEYDAVLMTTFEYDKMKGYICLANDWEGIKSILEEINPHRIPGGSIPEEFREKGYEEVLNKIDSLIN